MQTIYKKKFKYITQQIVVSLFSNESNSSLNYREYLRNIENPNPNSLERKKRTFGKTFS